MKINELNFNHLTIKYNGEEISKTKIAKIKTIEAIGVMTTIVLLFGAIILLGIFADIKNNFGLSLLIGFSLETAIILGGVFGTTALSKRAAPKHYEFVNWLTKFKENEIEIGWLNNRYIAQINSQSQRVEELGAFVMEDYYLYDSADKSKPIHMIIDLTKDDIEVVVKNK